MTMELEGNLLLERAHTRRWVSIIAIVIPVASFVLLAAWFIRIYIVPPTITIPSPAMMADTPPAPPTVSIQEQFEALQQQTAAAEPAVPPVAPPPPASERPGPVSALPMFATLAVAPPALNSAPPTYADPVPDTPPAPSPIVIAEPAIIAEPAAIEASEPVAGPVPLPRAKPHATVALVTSGVPLPRPRPVESTPAPPPEVPQIDRHTMQ